METSEVSVGLIENVRPLGRVVVRRQRHLRHVRGGGARHEVLVEAIVVPDHRAIAEGHVAGTMFDHPGRQVDLRLYVAQVGVAVERLRIDIGGPALK